MTQLLQDARQSGLVAITTSQQLSSLFLQLQAQPALASKIQAVYYNHAEVTVEQEADGSPPMNCPSIQARCIADLTFILEQITQKGQLESFIFVDDYCQTGDNVAAKSEAFWTVLAGASTTLNHLSIGFAPQELHELRDVVSVMTAPWHILSISLIEVVSCSLFRASDATS
jgi:hypothetical protein